MPNPTRVPLRTARTGMVSSGNAIASLIGVELLRRGGNAVDAAVGMGAAMAVLEPHLSHLGGDVFLQYWNAQTKTPHALNGSGAAPSGATLDAMGDRIPRRGIRAAAVPGAIDGWLLALHTWGTLDQGEVLAPAIALAEDGFALPAWQVALWQQHADLWDEFPDTKAAFVPDPLQPGATLRQPDLAQTLRDIAQQGRRAFYEGEWAERLLDLSYEGGGFFSRADLANHRSRILPPLSVDYRGVTVWGQPPPSQGHVLLEMLQIAEGFDLAAHSPESADAVHLLAEAKKLAFADRLAYMGDVPETPLATLLSKDYARQQRGRIQPRDAAHRFSPGRLPPDTQPPPDYGSDTTSLCVVDGQGNAVSLIQSVFHAFGSGVVVPGTGVLLNNRMTGFSLDPRSPNALAPGKRPVHTLNTWMLGKNGDLWAVGGTPGGDVQVQTNAQMISQLVDAGRDPQQAIESPKWHVPPDGPDLVVEDRLPLDTCYDLRRRGHTLTIGGPWSGHCACQVVMIDPDTHARWGASDPRADGLALGY